MPREFVRIRKLPPRSRRRRRRRRRRRGGVGVVNLLRSHRGAFAVAPIAAVARCARWTTPTRGAPTSVRTDAGDGDRRRRRAHQKRRKVASRGGLSIQFARTMRGISRRGGAT